MTLQQFVMQDFDTRKLLVLRGGVLNNALHIVSVYGAKGVSFRNRGPFSREGGTNEALGVGVPSA